MERVCVGLGGFCVSSIFSVCVCLHHQGASSDNGAGAGPRLYENWGPLRLTLSKSDSHSPAGWRWQRFASSLSIMSIMPRHTLTRGHFGGRGGAHERLN